MIPTALILQKSVLDGPAFLAACMEMLGYSPANAADSQHLEEMAYELSCLMAFKDKTAKPGVKNASNVYELSTIGCLVVADERDMPDILEVAGLPHTLTETTVRGIQAAFVVGNLRQWRTAIIKGCSKQATQYVRACYDTIYLQFRSIGLQDLFDRSQRNLDDSTFLLE